MSTSVQTDINTRANSNPGTVEVNRCAIHVNTFATDGHPALQGAHVVRPLTVAEYPSSDTTYLSRKLLAPESQYTMNCQSHDADSCAVAMSAIAQENDTHGWENFLEDTFCYLHGREMEEEDLKVKKSIRRGAKRYLTWNDFLFRRTPKGLRMVPPQADRPGILETLHDDVGHWDVNSTRDFVISRFWWPMVYRDIYDYVKSCDGCQRRAAVPHYKTDLHLPITTLFDVFSIDFAGHFPRTSSGNRFTRVAVEHLTGWPIARATKNATRSVVRRIMEMEVVNPFGFLRVVISDNAGFFKAEVLASYER